MTNRKHFDQHRRLFKDTNPNAALISFFALIGLLIVVLLLASCQKESSFTYRGKPVIEADHHLKPPEGFQTPKRAKTPELEAASRRGGIKGKPDKPPKGGDNPPSDSPYTPPPTYVVKNALLLDFDGQTVTGTSWNVQDTLKLAYSGMTDGEISSAIQQARAAFEPLGFFVTTDEALYNLAPIGKSHAIITESWEWYGRAGGVAYIGSFAWNPPTPCFVFSSLLGYSGRNVGYALCHELGHTLGLRHVPQRSADGSQISPYCSSCDNYMGGNYASQYPRFETYVLDLYDNPVNQIQVMQSYMR
jgi:hypothetical protein